MSPSGTDLIGIVSLRMLTSQDPIAQHKNFSIMQAVFSRATKQVIIELDSLADDYHLLVGLEEEIVVMPKMEAKKTPEKMVSKKVTVGVRGIRRIRPPLDLMTFFTYTLFLEKMGHGIKGNKSSKGLGITSVLPAIMQKINKVEEKVD